MGPRASERFRVSTHDSNRLETHITYHWYWINSTELWQRESAENTPRVLGIQSTSMIRLRRNPSPRASVAADRARNKTNPVTRF
ncbi:hypothetical protein EYF80_018986 [Liparis tanakae]|uniref:Uncharacterized protein n=1 Tax=Liparis tanakae TaxID=230148 RepID=A0A4Z2I0U3_9TELE|nr:hypothetical protein EYF80_018986 [Liparis tanakae]